MVMGKTGPTFEFNSNVRGLFPDTFKVTTYSAAFVRDQRGQGKKNKISSSALSDEGQSREDSCFFWKSFFIP